MECVFIRDWRESGPALKLHASRFMFMSSVSLRALDGSADSRTGHRPERLAGIVLVAVQLDATQAVGAHLDGEGRNGCVRAERTAGESLTIRAVIGQDLASRAKEREQRAKGKEQRARTASLRDGTWKSRAADVYLHIGFVFVFGPDAFMT